MGFFSLLMCRPVIFTPKVNSETTSGQKGRFLHPFEMEYFQWGKIWELEWEANHRIRDWLRLEGASGNFLSPTTLLIQGHLQNVAQDQVQSRFDSLQEWRPHHLPGQSVPVLSDSFNKKEFADVQRECPVFLCASPAITERCLSSSVCYSWFNRQGGVF